MKRLGSHPPGAVAYPAAMSRSQSQGYIHIKSRFFRVSWSYTCPQVFEWISLHRKISRYDLYIVPSLSSSQYSVG